MRTVRTVGIIALWSAIAASAFAQDRAETRRLFQAGQYDQVVAQGAGADADPTVLMMAAQSHQKLGASEQARQLYQQLAGRPETDPWHFIGQSAGQLLDDQPDAAIASAERAVALGDALPDSHYQLGLVLAFRQRWPEAAASFDRAAELDPSLAYASYYGGLMHYRANRPDLMAVRFERFLKLAPEAPERPEVQQIMRTIRGR